MNRIISPAMLYGTSESVAQSINPAQITVEADSTANRTLINWSDGERMVVRFMAPVLE